MRKAIKNSIQFIFMKLTNISEEELQKRIEEKIQKQFHPQIQRILREKVGCKLDATMDEKILKEFESIVESYSIESQLEDDHYESWKILIDGGIETMEWELPRRYELEKQIFLQVDEARQTVLILQKDLQQLQKENPQENLEAFEKTLQMVEKRIQILSEKRKRNSS